MIGISADVTKSGNTEDIEDKITAIFKKIVYSLERNITIEAPVDEGLLRGSIHSDFSTDERSAVVGTNVYYAPYVNFGTAAHIIVPSNKKALKFKVNGKDVFSKRVFHPGTQPNPFFERGMEITKREVQAWQ